MAFLFFCTGGITRGGGQLGFDLRDAILQRGGFAQHAQDSLTGGFEIAFLLQMAILRLLAFVRFGIEFRAPIGMFGLERLPLSGMLLQLQSTLLLLRFDGVDFAIERGQTLLDLLHLLGLIFELGAGAFSFHIQIGEQLARSGEFLFVGVSGLEDDGLFLFAILDGALRGFEF